MRMPILRIAVLSVCVVFVGFLLARSLVSDEPKECAPKYPAKDFTGKTAYSVVRIIDGDTLVVSINNKDITVRLIGVDTPETVHPQKQVEAYGKEASAFLSNLLKGEEVYVEYEKNSPELDKYNRLLAYLYRVPDGLFVNLEIVRQGYGHAYTQYPFKHMELFRAYEKRARAKEKGLWGPEVQKKESDSPTGTEGKAKDNSVTPKEEPAGVTVYITKTGAKYHRAGCRYLSKSCIPISLEEAKKRGYGPCSVCNPPK